MKSMTGFGSHLSGTDEFQIESTVRALNSRYLEVRFLMPVQFNPFESEMRSLVQNYFERGRVDLILKRKVGSKTLTHKSVVRSEVAKIWIESYKKLGEDLKLKAEPSLDMISRLPDVITMEENMEIDSSEKKILLEALKSALEACDKEREREGSGLQKIMLSLLEELEAQVMVFGKLREAANKEIRKNMQDKIEALGLKKLEQEPRYMQEVAMMVEKSDISEEISRLGEHVKAMKDLVGATKSQGKKLDFYTQELLREINTIGSKSQVAKLTQSVVEAKAIVERIREQAQNIE
ncbi:MAG: YicC/YloC family endoribonuclease [Bdellovibrionales bacterium]